jgi:hypothetical protein
LRISLPRRPAHRLARVRACPRGRLREPDPARGHRRRRHRVHRRRPFNGPATVVEIYSCGPSTTVCAFCQRTSRSCRACARLLNSLWFLWGRERRAIAPDHLLRPVLPLAGGTVTRRDRCQPPPCVGAGGPVRISDALSVWHWTGSRAHVTIENTATGCQGWQRRSRTPGAFRMASGGWLERGRAASGWRIPAGLTAHVLRHLTRAAWAAGLVSP